MFAQESVMENPEKIEIAGLKTIHKLCNFGADHNMEGCTFTEIVERMFTKIEQMKTQVNTLDEMLLNQGEALAQAKAQAVPEWISVNDKMPDEGDEVFVHHYGHIVQATKDQKFSGGFKQRNCYGWEAVSSYISHWMPMSIGLPQSYHFYYVQPAKQAQEQSHECQNP